MIKKVTAATLALALSTSASFAEESSESGEFYIVTKALFTTGETVKEGSDIEVEGKAGGGVGIDIGYTLPYHFAVELDTSYDKNGIHETKQTTLGPEEEDGMGTFWTYAMDVTYTVPVTEELGVMGKVGYEFERETITNIDATAHDSGMVYGAGLEYHIVKHYEALVEYEGSTIDSPRGSSVYAGVKYIF